MFQQHLKKGNLNKIMNQLGYACINMNLSNHKPKITTNRSMIKRTFTEKGLPYASELALQYCKDLLTILMWNNDNGINFFRLSSDLMPWASEYDITTLPHYTEISNTLKESSLLLIVNIL